MRGHVILGEYSVSAIKEFAKKYLICNGAKVWPINNAPVRKRKGTTHKGFPDLAGHNRAGLAVYCEAKTVRDRISEDQIEFLVEAENNGCLCFIATQFKAGEQIEVVSFREYLERKNISIIKNQKQ